MIKLKMELHFWKSTISQNCRNQKYRKYDILAKNKYNYNCKLWKAFVMTWTEAGIKYHDFNVRKLGIDNKANLFLIDNKKKSITISLLQSIYD